AAIRSVGLRCLERGHTLVVSGDLAFARTPHARRLALAGRPTGRTPLLLGLLRRVDEPRSASGSVLAGVRPGSGQAEPAPAPQPDQVTRCPSRARGHQ